MYVCMFLFWSTGTFFHCGVVRFQPLAVTHFIIFAQLLDLYMHVGDWVCTYDVLVTTTLAPHIRLLDKLWGPDQGYG